jgi:hypothetical protein
MPYSVRVKVIGLGTDSDPFTGAGYTSVTLAVDSPIPRPPQQLQNVYPPVPRPVVHKHIMHVFIPTTQWRGQYTMWAEYDLVVQDDGSLRLDVANERVESSS